MKTINLNTGVKAHIGDWDEAFCLCRGQQFGIYGEFHDDEAQAADKLKGMGASPMQAAIDMYGHRGRWKRQEQGTNPALDWQ